MRIKKTIEVGVRIDDYLTAASALEESLMAILKQKYEGRCYCCCFITKVLRIVKYGPLLIDPVSASRANISVNFEVEAMILARGEVIVGCRVERRDTTKLITCTSENAIILAEDAILDSMKEGQFIMLEAVESQYPIMTKTITTSAIPFLPPVDKHVYAVNGSINERDRARLSELVISMQHAESENLISRTANTRGYEFFEQQLYPFKQRTAPTGANIVPIMDLIDGKLDGKLVSRDARLGYATDKLAVWDTATDMITLPETRYSPYEIAIILITEYIDSLRVIREMIGVYNTPELIKSHVGLWLMFKTAKK